MGRPFRPGCWINDTDKHDKTKWVSFPTYRELKKNIVNLLSENGEDVHVFRTRRGEWGEWFEIWTLSNNKAVIRKQGWN